MRQAAHRRRPSSSGGDAARRLLSFLGLTLGIAVVGGGACEQSDADGQQCEPGTEVFCRCPDGEAGVRECDDDGEEFSECRLGPDEPCPERPPETNSGSGGGGSTFCDPGTAVFCTCDGANGQKVCLPDGSAYGSCECAGPTSSGPSGGGGAGGAPTTSSSGQGGQQPLPLYAPCVSSSACDSGLCTMGYCTKNCVAFDDCELSVSECVAFAGSTICRPKCSVQNDCGPYQEPSTCGYASAVDGFGVTVCADWLSSLAFPPDGKFCDDDLDCSLGHVGKERICNADNSGCDMGCHEHGDCPGALICDATSEPGFCY